MRRCRRLLTICFASIYLCVIYTDILLSASKKSPTKKTTKKSTNKNKGKRAMAPNATKALTEMMNDVDMPETETSEQTQTTTNITETPVTETTNTNNETVSESVNIDIELTDDQLYKTVPSHEKWEDFKFCMQQQCMGGTEQPANVECYKNLNFDNSFQSCKIMIGDVAQYSIFEKYFKEVFLPAEQAEACDSLFAGKWNAEKKTCDVTITYTRKYDSQASSSMRAKNVGCNDNKTRVVNIPTNGTSIKLNCSYETFGLDVCYSDSAKLAANKAAKIIGGVSIGVGAAAGAAAGLAAGLKKQTKTEAIKDEDGKVIGMQTVDIKKLDKDGNETNKYERAGAWEGITAGLDASKGMILEGVGQVVTASASKNDHGEPVLGSCRLPDNTTYSEGSIMELSW